MHGLANIGQQKIEKCCLMNHDFCHPTIGQSGQNLSYMKHESMDPSCLLSMVQAGSGGVMVRRIFSWHTLVALVPTEYCLNNKKTQRSKAVLKKRVQPVTSKVDLIKRSVSVF